MLKGTRLEGLATGALIGTRRPDNTDELAAATRRNALAGPHFRRQMASTGRKVIGHPAPLYLWGDAWPGACLAVIEHFSCPDNRLVGDWPRPPKPLHPRDLCATITAIGWERYWAATRPIRILGLLNKH